MYEEKVVYKGEEYPPLCKWGKHRNNRETTKALSNYLMQYVAVREILVDENPSKIKYNQNQLQRKVTKWEKEKFGCSKQGMKFWANRAKTAYSNTKKLLV